MYSTKNTVYPKPNQKATKKSFTDSNRDGLPKQLIQHAIPNNSQEQIME